MGFSIGHDLEQFLKLDFYLVFDRYSFQDKLEIVKLSFLFINLIMN